MGSAEPLIKPSKLHPSDNICQIKCQYLLVEGGVKDNEKQNKANPHSSLHFSRVAERRSKRAISPFLAYKLLIFILN